MEIDLNMERAKAYMESTREQFKKNVEEAKKHWPEGLEGGVFCGPTEEEYGEERQEES